jgi:hypothetical protein
MGQLLEEGGRERGKEEGRGRNIQREQRKYNHIKCSIKTIGDRRRAEEDKNRTKNKSNE